MQFVKSSKVNIWHYSPCYNDDLAYVLKEDGRHMVFLFAPEVPIFALKEIAQQSANQLVNIRL